jgi:uncharacterized membrane protein
MSGVLAAVVAVAAVIVTARGARGGFTAFVALLLGLVAMAGGSFGQDLISIAFAVASILCSIAAFLSYSKREHR